MSPILEMEGVLHLLAWWELERTIRALGFGARMCVSAPLNSPEELLTLERVPYTERLGKDTAISDCNNSQTDFWEQTLIRAWSLPPRAICSPHRRKKLQLSPVCVHSVCCAGSKSGDTPKVCSLLPLIPRHHGRGWSWGWHGTLVVCPAEVCSFVGEAQAEPCSCRPPIALTHINLSLQLTPIISDPEYLLDQHILISIKSSDSDESYGKCLALKFCMSQNLLRFFRTAERVGDNRSHSYRLNIYDAQTSDLELNTYKNTLWTIFCEVMMIRGIWTRTNDVCELYQP